MIGVDLAGQVGEASPNKNFVSLFFQCAIVSERLFCQCEIVSESLFCQCEIVNDFSVSVRL